MYGINYSKAISELHKAIVELNSKHKIELEKLKLYKSSSMDIESIYKRLLTIKNPERLNTNNNHIKGEWVIEYMGRDLSLEEDNYRWDIHNGEAGIRGYYIIEREFHADEWLYVRWGNLPTNVKERRETIHKGRLRDMDIIERDMVNAVRGTINRIK